MYTQRGVYHGPMRWNFVGCLITESHVDILKTSWYTFPHSWWQNPSAMCLVYDLKQI